MKAHNRSSVTGSIGSTQRFSYQNVLCYRISDIADNLLEIDADTLD